MVLLNIHDAAWFGDCEYLSESFLADLGTRIDEVDPERGLTPLGAAVWNGHVKVVQLLLKHGADINKQSDTRTPIWIAATRTKENVDRIAQILLKRGADPTIPSENDYNSTPLLNAVRENRSTDLIQMLVDHGALPEVTDDEGESAQTVAESANDRAVLSALLPRSKRKTRKAEAVAMVVSLVLFIVAWANASVPVLAVGGVIAAAASASAAIKMRFNLSGVFDPIIPKFLKNNRPAKEFKADIEGYIKQSRLERFFPPGDDFLHDVVTRALKLEFEPKNALNTKELTKVSLYQHVLYCDDSGSMKKAKDGRAESQKELAKRITSVTTRIVPDGGGIELRFINQRTERAFSRPSLDQIEAIISKLSFDGWTEIGTNLKKKILTPLVYQPIEDGGQLSRPLLVSIITDGCPRGDSDTLENRNTFRQAILECVDFLEEHGYERNAVRFQISQIGDDDEADEFLDRLRSEKKLSKILYCTTDRLDEKYKDLSTNEKRLEQWLLKLLMSPITIGDRT